MNSFRKSATLVVSIFIFSPVYAQTDTQMHQLMNEPGQASSTQTLNASTDEQHLKRLSNIAEKQRSELNNQGVSDKEIDAVIAKGLKSGQKSMSQIRAELKKQGMTDAEIDSHFNSVANHLEKNDAAVRELMQNEIQKSKN